ncbi:hypothetical protein [Candidatus Leptofilum sp.]|uniref:hypothetical protein n=1 Tax=Candidatus Leptofilum sp. TaxID=3241576 RepID=UPI003B59D231
MKRIKFVGMGFFILLLVLTVTGSVFAGSAYNAAFTTSITYQNVGSGDATIVFSFYPENDGTAIPINATLPQGAGASLYVGGLSQISSGFNGSVVMSSDQPVVATMVQISSDSDVKVRPLSNGFSGGSDKVLLATVLKNQNNTTSRFSIQNAHSTAVDITVEIFNADNPSATPITITHDNLPVGASKTFDMGQLSAVTASSFNGSATVTAVEAGTSTPANIVGTVLELKVNSGLASSFEGVASGSTTLYMPSALCQFGSGGASTAYAIQNTSDSTAANVTVTYSNGATDTATIQPGAKNSFITCDVTSAGYLGSSTIVSNNSVEIIGVAKVFGGGRSAAFLGAGEGASTLAMPYVRFTQSQWAVGGRQRAYIAIQNVGSNLASGELVASYLNKDGEVVATHTFGAIANGVKVNTNASDSALVLASGHTQDELDEFGYVGGFGGSILVEGPPGSELVATVRILTVTSTGTAAEDYNGIPVGN